MLPSINKSDRPILVLCCICIGICAYFLTSTNSFFAVSTGESEAIGSITAIKADVRHKSKNEYFWGNTKINFSLSKGDSLYTGSGSSSEVKLKDGKVLKISQNSLVRFSNTKDKFAIDLAFGAVKASGLTQQIVISDCGQNYTIDPNKAEFELTKDKKCGSFKILVKSGDVKVNKRKVKKTFQTKSAPSTIANTFQKVVNTIEVDNVVIDMPIVPDSEPDFNLTEPIAAIIPEPVVETIAEPVVEAIPEPVVEAPPVELKTPNFLQKNKKMALQQNRKILVSWAPVDLAENYTLEIDTDPRFSNPNIITTNETQYKFTATKAAKFNFRLKANAPAAISSAYADPLRLEIFYPLIEVEQLRLTETYQTRSPADEGQKKMFPIKWNKIPTAEKYVIEVDSNPAFNNPTKTEVFSEAGFAEVPKTGRYHFRVSAYNEKNRQISSMPSIGEIVYKKVLQLASPVIDKSLQALSIYFQKEYGQFIWLRWNPTKVVSKYRLEISKQQDFKKLESAYLTQDSKFLIKSKLTQGQYFWRVRTEHAGQASAWSDTAHVKVQTK